MIEISVTVESMEQAEALLQAGADTIYFGEEQFGLRLPTSFNREEQRILAALAHQYGKKAIIAVNGLMHPEKMKLIPDYLAFLKSIEVDQIMIGDPGIIYLLKKSGLSIPYSYDGETLVTSSRQINFWAKKGAVGAVLAREVPYEEMLLMAPNLEVPVEILVYGATCIHQSKRLLLKNYYAYKKLQGTVGKERDLFLAEPKRAETHYSIYEDSHGTHIFADNDVNLINELPKLVHQPYNHWKLDGLYTPGASFVEIAKIFMAAKSELLSGNWTDERVLVWQQKIKELHPEQRGLDSGFFHVAANEIK